MGQEITLELQFPIDKCRADFLINDCLIVEIDGAAYHTSKEAVARDARRDKYIRRQGFHILRIPAKYLFIALLLKSIRYDAQFQSRPKTRLRKTIPRKSAFFIMVQ